MERELAELLLKMGERSGLEVERAADEIAAMSLPSFVNSRSFRSAVLEAVEANMRSQMEQRLRLMRQKFDVQGSSGSTMERPLTPSPASPHPVAAVAVSEQNTVGGLDTIIGDMSDQDEGASDATIVWSPRRD